MKLLATLGVLALVVAPLLLRYRRVRRAKTEQPPDSGGSQPRVLLVRVETLLVAFAQFWLLTGILPIRLVLFLIAAAVAGEVVFSLLGAAAGFTLPEKKEKFLALTMIWMSRNRFLTCGSLGGHFLGSTVSLVAAFPDG